MPAEIAHGRSIFGGLMGSKSTATWLTVAVLILFIVVVGLGWWFLLASQIRVLPMVALVTVALMVFAAFLAKQISQVRADAAREGKSASWHRGWQAYGFLLIITALGTLNAAFVLFESRTMLRQDISTVRGAYGQLRAVARQDLVPKDYVDRSARVEALLHNLREEIINPNGGNYCGVGPSARAIIGEIQAVIPTYRVLNGSGPIKPCDMAKAQAVYAAYERMAREMLKGDATFIAVHGQAKLDYMLELDAHYAHADQTLGAIEQNAEGFGSAELIDKHDLYAARDHYNADHAAFVALNGQDDPSLVKLNSLLSERVNSYGSLFELFYHRMGNLRSWIYLVLAFAVDFALIYFWTKYNTLYGHPRKPPGEPEPVAPSPEVKRYETDPRYLWSDPVRR